MVFPVVGGDGKPTGYEIENSLRFNGSSSEMEDTLGTPTNIKKFTISLWFKRSALYADITTGQSLISCYRGAVGNPFGALNFGGNDHIEFFGFDDENTTVMNIQTNAARFRDIAAWYHIVFAVDTTQGTASNRVKVYINGVQETDLATETYPSQNKELAWNQSGTVHYIGHYQYTNATWMNGYEAEFAFIDGSQLTASSFGETNNDGIWIPKEFKDDVTFGNNGYYLEFKQTGTSQNSSGIGADTSGNDRHFAVSNLAAIDVTTDTPTNNFATFNSLANRISYKTTFTEGNTDADFDDSNYGIALTTQAAMNGKWYAEFKIIAVGGTVEVGVSDPTQTSNTISTKYRTYMQTGQKENDDYSNRASYGDTFTANDIIGVAMDLDNGNIYFYKNGTIQNSGTAAFTDLVSAMPISGWCFYAFGYNDAQVQLNTGNAPFSISSGNSDGAGHGNFEYSVPSGYFALCTKNLATYG